MVNAIVGKEGMPEVVLDAEGGIRGEIGALLREFGEVETDVC